MAVDLVVQETFSKILDAVRARVGDRMFEMWFRRAKLISIFRGCLTLAVPTLFVRDWVEERYSRLLEDAAEEVVGTPLKVAYQVDPSLIERVRSPVEILSEPEDGRHASGFRLEEFLPTAGNEMALRAVEKAAQEPAAAWNPILLHGGEGTGKTHLLRGFVAAAAPARRALLMTAIEFTNKFTFLLKTKQVDRFHRDFDRWDAFVIDELHDLQGKKATQRELRELITQWTRRGRQVVLASRAHPKDIPEIDPGLESVLLAGMVVRIDPPDPATVVRILLGEFVRSGRSVPEPAVRSIAARVPGNVKELDRTIRKVFAYAALTGESVTEEFLERNLLEIRGAGDPLECRLEIVLSTIEKHFGIERRDLFSKRKTRSLSVPRGLAVYLLREHLDLTFKEVGRLMGERSHTSVYLIYKRFAARVQVETELQAVVREASRRLLTAGSVDGPAASAGAPATAP